MARTLVCRPRVVLLEERIDPATLVVTNPNDDPRQLLAGSFRAALAQAQNGDVITFAASMNGQTIQEGVSPGPEGFVINKNIRILGPGSDKLTFRGLNTGLLGINKRVFDVQAGAVVSMSGFTITNGNGFGIDQGGGGIRNFGTISVRDVKFQNNSASFGGTTYGGAVYNNGSAFFYDCMFSNNASISMPSRSQEPAPELAYGGAIYSASGRLDLIGCTFKQNTASASGLRNADAFGGAIYTVNTEMHVKACLFSENLAHGETSHTFFVGSSATGGAIGIDGGTATIDSTRFIFNRADAQDNTTGGAIAVTGNANVVARNIWLNHNEISTSPPVLSVATSASAYGAGVAVIQANLSLNNTIITNNVATIAEPVGPNVTPSVRGGGLYNASYSNTVVLHNTVIAHNYVNGPNASGPDVFGTVHSRGHNFISVTEGATIIRDGQGKSSGWNLPTSIGDGNGAPTHHKPPSSIGRP